MARRPIWHDDYWLLLIKLFLKRPQGVKRLYSKDLVDVALELHLHPTYIHRKLMQLRSIDTPRLQRMWDRYATSPRRLSRGIALLRQMKGFGNADAFFAGVTEETETWEKDFQPIAFTLPDGKPNTSLTPAMLIMILDLYFRLTPLTMVPETPEVQELAKLMRINPTQVASVMEVFRVCDPYITSEEFIVSPLLTPCMEVWKRFGNDPEQLTALAAQLKDYWK
ncbi:MAG: hypothetical protein SPL67_07220 [Prevotella sp.]|jgi:hypothetical protein|nr:hypothetical protein [Prevotella sp.]MDY6241893.1 hypothetical protein [Prevotella sp.]